MQVEVVMPKMGESIQEGKILRWAKKPGDKVQRDETILEISTDKVDSEIPSPASGILTKIVVPENETVEVGTVIAIIETDEVAAKAMSPAPSSGGIELQITETAPKAEKAESTRPSTAPSEPLRRRANGDRFYSPLVRTIAEKEGLSRAELDSISGSGVGGRVTKNDVLGYLRTRTPGQAGGQLVRRSVSEGGGSGIRPSDIKELAKKYPSPQYEIRQMDNIQQKMAEHMIRSVQTSPHVQAISECDLSRIVAFRSEHAAAFENREGFKLTFTPFFLDATVRALKQFPLVNSSVEGDKIILKRFINLGMAVATPGGLIVPVIQHAEEKSFLGMARAANDIGVRARNKKLRPDDIQGGTFTVTNYGVFGNIIGIPIINQPQVAILGFGAIKKRPVVVTDEKGTDAIAIRSMCYLTLSFDHRILDGAVGGQFVETVVSNLENFDFGKLF
jgi:2-oxoglutarate dehydrogenase dihydrolipoamide succinyltransferase (E2 component)